MKSKYLVVGMLLIILAIGLAGCTPNEPDFSSEVQVSWVVYSNLDEMVKAADDVLLIEDIVYRGIEKQTYDYHIYEASVVKHRLGKYPLGEFQFKVMKESQDKDATDLLKSIERAIVFVKQFEDSPPAILNPYHGVIGVKADDSVVLTPMLMRMVEEKQFEALPGDKIGDLDLFTDED